MKVFAAVAGALALCLSTSAWPETRQFDAPGLHALQISGAFRVQIVSGDTPSVVIEGSAEDLRRVHVSSSRGVLRLNGECTFGCDYEGIDVTARITVPTLDRVEVSKGAQVQIAGLRADDLRIAVSMGGVLEIAGSCDSLRVDVSMGGQLAAGAFACREVDVDAGMGGVARINASERVNAGANMGGEIEVSGAPSARQEREFMGGAVSIQ
jgi:hypothetical protein